MVALWHLQQQVKNLWKMYVVTLNLPESSFKAGVVRGRHGENG